MGTYINSKGEAVDTSDLEATHLQRALAKAKAEGNSANIKALEEEIESRNG